jgi:aminoglycoside 6-adenylyltransferase
MRTENEVFKQILDFASSEDRVRAVMLNGSRLNSNAPKDILQDYDVVFFITDIDKENFKLNPSWINRFGELVIMQQNDFEDGSYIFLMQFKDGVRIDLSFRDINKIEELAREDTLSKIILDKDNLNLQLPRPNDSIHYVKKPEKQEFEKTLNEAWWIQTYVAKAICRDELPLAKYMFDVVLIDCIRKLLSWQIGEAHSWSINVGKCGKWLKRFLPEDNYNEFITLYPTIDYEEMWQALFKAGKFIQKIGEELAVNLGYDYPSQDTLNVTQYLQKIKALPKDSTDFWH